jgi:hypothetical protein
MPAPAAEFFGVSLKKIAAVKVKKAAKDNLKDRGDEK